MGKKFVVTGGAGFIGSHLVDALVEKDNEVYVVDTFVGGRYEDRIHSRATYHEVDIRETKRLQRILERSEAVFHTAALPRVQYSVDHPVETTEVNATGTVSVLAAASQANVRRVVSSSSSSVYGTQESLPLAESLPANPGNPYGLQKYVGELYMKMWSKIYNIETVSLRYFNVYGPRLDPHGSYALAVGAFLLARKEGRPLTIYGDGTVTRDYTHVSDVVRANLSAVDSVKVGRGEVINVGTGKRSTIQALAELIGGEIQYGPPRVEAHDSEADNRLAKELLGWKPQVSLEEGITELKREYGL